MSKTLLKTVACLVFATPILAATPGVQFDNPLLRQRADPLVMLHSDGQYFVLASAAEWVRLELRLSGEGRSDDEAHACGNQQNWS